MKHPDFPAAPPGSYVCEEGWLIVGDEAWTREEWRQRWAGPIDKPERGRRYATEQERREARRRTKREYNRRVRGTAA